jgi:hypothetical protein
VALLLRVQQHRGVPRLLELLVLLVLLPLLLLLLLHALLLLLPPLRV